MPKIALVINNVRSANNVGSMLRSADGFGVSKVYICGYSPYPEAINDNRLPHIRKKAAKAIHKTALGAEKSVDWEYQADINTCLEKLEQNDYVLAALEQTDSALKLDKFNPDGDIALIVGNEISGIDKNLLDRVKIHLQIPMLGQKESLNVAVAAAIAIYHLHTG